MRARARRLYVKPFLNTRVKYLPSRHQDKKNESQCLPFMVFCLLGVQHCANVVHLMIITPTSGVRATAQPDHEKHPRQQ